MKLEKKEREAEIPTSSMADIAFLLIVFFMVTAVFSATKGIDFKNPPPQEESEIIPEESIHIYVTPENQLQVDQKPMALSELKGYMKPKLEINQAKPVIVQCDPESTYEGLMNVFDEIRQLEGEIWGKDEDGNVKNHVNLALPTQEEIAQWGQFL
jgi:biopolymer transport protein ExbD